MNLLLFRGGKLYACLGFLALTMGTLAGCGKPSGVVQETSELSYQDVASQLAAEEAASQQSTEAVR